MTAQSADELAAQVTRLVSFPDVAMRVNAMLSDDNSGAEEIGAVIEPDPALSAALLRLANSALYHVGGTITTVARAVTVVGLREVRDLTFGICAAKVFDGIPNDLITVEDFWRHSLNVAIAARRIGKRARLRGSDSLFTAGLLHDIGHLVMFSEDPDRSRQALELSLDMNDGRAPYLAEREIFGYDHADVGGALARQWGLPAVLEIPIRYHHDPFVCEPVCDVTLVVHIADGLAVLVELDSEEFDDAPPINDAALAKLGIQRSDLLVDIAGIKTDVEDLIRMLVD